MFNLICIFVGSTIIKEELQNTRHPYKSKFTHTPLLINHNWKRLDKYTWNRNNKNDYNIKYGKTLIDTSPRLVKDKRDWYYRSYEYQFRIKKNDILSHKNCSWKISLLTEGRTFIDYLGFRDNFVDVIDNDTGNIKYKIDKLERIWHPCNGNFMYKIHGLHSFGNEIQPNANGDGFTIFKINEIMSNRRRTRGNLIYEMIPHHVKVNNCGDLIVCLSLSHQRLGITFKNENGDELINFKWQIPDAVYRTMAIMPKCTVIDYNFKQIDQIPITDRKYPFE